MDALKWRARPLVPYTLCMAWVEKLNIVIYKFVGWGVIAVSLFWVLITLVRGISGNSQRSSLEIHILNVYVHKATM